jgi:hypothetical protein
MVQAAMLVTNTALVREESFFDIGRIQLVGKAVGHRTQKPVTPKPLIRVTVNADLM